MKKLAIKFTDVEVAVLRAALSELMYRRRSELARAKEKSKETKLILSLAFERSNDLYHRVIDLDREENYE